MNEAKVLRGPWAGASAPAATRRVVLTELIDVDYRCPDGHRTHVRFGQPVIPPTWECGTCARTANRDPAAEDA